LEWAVKPNITLTERKCKMEVNQKLAKARSLLVLDQPFFGVLALKMAMVEDGTIPTMCTDGTEIRFSPQFVEQLTVNQLKAVIAHEVLHCGLGHCWRIGDRDLQQWNIAADYAVNDILLKSNFDLPDDCLKDPAYANMATEEVYQKIYRPPQPSGGQGQGQGKEQGNGQPQGNQQGNGQGNGQNQSPGSGPNQDNNPDPGGCGGITPVKDKQQAKELEQEWKSAMVAAAAVAKGKLPAEMKRLVDKIINPELPWHVLLRDFVEKTARNDYNWMRANRRHMVNGVWLPSLLSEELPEIVVAVDTSGSITDKQLQKFAAEASGVLEAYRTTIRVIYCDASVAGEETFTNEDLPLKLTPKGGGGTDFRPVFTHVDKVGYTPACLVYFTDMYGNFPKLASPYPTMWVSTTKEKDLPARYKAPWGEFVEFN
jgi:predicted metal-dependent peptidase